MEVLEENCILCGKKLKDFKTVKVKRGLESLKIISSKRKDGIAEKLEGLEEVDLHVECRRFYTRHPDKTGISAVVPCVPVPLLRRNIPQFDFKSCCLYCGEKIDKEDAKKHPERYPRICQVETLGKIATIRSNCDRRNDDWSRIVRSRIDTECDLVAAEAQYHKSCDSAFAVVASCMPSRLPVSLRGRKCDEAKVEAFNKLCDFLDNNDDCQYLVSDLLQKMSEFSSDGSVYSEKYFKEQLIGRYGESIVLSPSMRSFGTIVSLRPLASRVLTEKWYTERKTNVTEEKKRILDAAIIIIQEEIRSQVHDCSSYPTPEEISNGGVDQMGEMLGHLLSGLMKPINGEARVSKVLTVAHSIISSVRPRSFVSAVQVGIGVFTHKRFRSRQLIDILHSLGVSVSYSEICKYESSVTLHSSNDVQKEGFVQFVFDNADHNTRTVDGHGTFHVLGGVQCVTPASAVQTEIRFPRPKTLPNAPAVGKFGFIPIISYNRPKNIGLKQVEMEDVLALKLRPQSAHLAFIYDWIWMAGPGTDDIPRTGWSGFMEIAAGEQAYEKSAVIPLPFINLQPTNLTTINTCLRFAAKECQKRGQKCIVTFDQPLFIKAVDIVSQADENDVLSSIIVRLGGFHLLMSYMGAVAKIMGGSGFEEMWEQVYAQNAVIQMVNGHAYARALRAHSLSQAAIASLLFEHCHEIGTLSSCDIKHLHEVYSEIFNTCTDKESLLSKVEPLLRTLETTIVALEEKSRTAKLWLQYFRQISIMHDFVRAERTGDWRLHLFSVQRMLCHLHAAGHIHYAKAAHLYLQNMVKLESKMSAQEFECFVEKGFFTVRRSDKFWCGVWSDMTIEQVLMRTMKESGGITQCRGKYESVLARWISTMPWSIRVTEAVEAFAKVTCDYSDQHVSLSRSWQKRDSNDLNKFVSWLKQHSPFNKSEELVSLSSGIIASEKVNCDSAIEIGENSIRSVIGQSFQNVIIKRKAQVVTLAAMRKEMLIDQYPVVVNPNQLFHRITCVVRSEDDLEDFLRYELAPYPQSLFDNVGLRRGIKSKIIHIVDKMCKISNNLPENPFFIVDGGDLLHRVHWPQPATYGDVCNTYIEYIKRHYGSSVIVVFDGYQPSTKDAEHARRTIGKSAAKLEVTESNTVYTSKGQFLSNVTNKSNFVKFLITALKKSNICVFQATGDADVLILQTAKKEAESGRDTIVVGTDSDLFVLIAGFTLPKHKIYMLVPENPTAARKVYSNRELHEGLGSMKDYLLFIHAMMGCDTTSAFFNKGPNSGFSKLQNDPELQSVVKIFNEPVASQDSIAAAGEAFIVKLYGGKIADGLDKTRFKKYIQTVGKKPPNYIMNLASLPPSSAAARQHSLRVYHQVQAWHGNNFPPQEWGWIIEHEKHVPIPSTLPPAPDKLLYLVRCGCKGDCSRNCECRKGGLHCTTMCGVCAGESCTNKIIHFEDKEDDEDYIN